MSIREGKVALITCPDGSCPDFETKINLISAREIKILVSPELYETYKRFRLNWMIENDPTRTWCPTPNCETICYVKRIKSKDKPIAVFCSTVSKLHLILRTFMIRTLCFSATKRFALRVERNGIWGSTAKSLTHKKCMSFTRNHFNCK